MSTSGVSSAVSTTSSGTSAGRQSSARSTKLRAFETPRERGAPNSAATADMFRSAEARAIHESDGRRLQLTRLRYVQRTRTEGAPFRDERIGLDVRVRRILEVGGREHRLRFGLSEPLEKLLRRFRVRRRRCDARARDVDVNALARKGGPKQLDRQVRVLAHESPKVIAIDHADIALPRDNRLHELRIVRERLCR